MCISWRGERDGLQGSVSLAAVKWCKKERKSASAVALDDLYMIAEYLNAGKV
jgi:hypothetical protein